MAGALQAGVVWQNTYNKFDPSAAFGGYKESGFGREGGHVRAAAVGLHAGWHEQRLAVRKTYKLYVGGAFVRSESGRHDPSGGTCSTSHVASRKDVRDAVKAARGKASAGWATRNAYNRGQVLYRFAEALESRSGGRSARERRTRVEASIDVLVHYAGWTDKLAAGARWDQPGRRSVLSFSLPEPTGVVGIVAPDEPAATRG